MRQLWIFIIFTKVLYIAKTVIIQDYRLFWQHHLRQWKVHSIFCSYVCPSRR